MSNRADHPYEGRPGAGPEGVTPGRRRSIPPRRGRGRFSCGRPAWDASRLADPGLPEGRPVGGCRHQPPIRCGEVRSAGVEPATPRFLVADLYRWVTNAWSRRPVPTRTAPFTRGCAQPCAAAGPAGGEGMGYGLYLASRVVPLEGVEPPYPPLTSRRGLRPSGRDRTASGEGMGIRVVLGRLCGSGPGGTRTRIPWLYPWRSPRPEHSLASRRSGSRGHARLSYRPLRTSGGS